MHTYQVHYAEDVPHYGITNVEAATLSDAIAAAMAHCRGQSSHFDLEPDWENPVCRRIVTITAPNDDVVAENIRLDNSFLRFGDEADERLCALGPVIVDKAEALISPPYGPPTQRAAPSRPQTWMQRLSWPRRAPANEPNSCVFRRT